MNRFINKKYDSIIIFILIFVFTLFYSIFIKSVEFDEVWNYGFSYNISKGMIIYRDFNMVITPLYNIVGALFIKFFGNYIISLHILDSFLISGIILMLYRIIKKKVFIIYPIIILYTSPSYNLLCLFWVVLILYFIYIKRDNNILLGVIIGLSFITKQTVGICLLVPYLYYSRNKVKGIILFIIPFILLSIYLIYNNAFYDFINYCFLGMFDFGKDNTNINILFILEFGICIILFIMLIRSKFRNKYLFYILAYQIIGFPLGDMYHFSLMLSLIIFYYLYCYDNKYITLGMGVMFYYLLILFNLNNINIVSDNNYLYLRNINKLFYTNIKNKYYSVNRYNSDYKFIISGDSYFIKLYGNIDITKYDLLLNGNMGYDGSKRYIKDINNKCINSKCVFYVNKYIIFDKSNQLSREIYDYVINNYSIYSSDSNFNIYSNFVIN